MYSKVEMISPQKAEMYLTKNIKNNRKVNAATVRRYATDMKDGRWQLTSQGITFNEDGELTDGQHRLHAIIKSGRTIKMNVTYDEPNRATIHDRGMVRSIHSMMLMKGLDYRISCPEVVGAIKVIFYMKGNNAPTEQEIISFAEENFENLYTSKLLAGKRNNYKAVAKKSGVMAAAFCALYSGIDKNILNDFFEIVSSGFCENKSQYSAIVLRNFLIDGWKKEFNTASRELSKRQFTVASLAISDFVNGNPRMNIYRADAMPKYINNIEIG